MFKKTPNDRNGHSKQRGNLISYMNGNNFPPHTTIIFQKNQDHLYKGKNKTYRKFKLIFTFPSF